MLATYIARTWGIHDSNPNEAFQVKHNLIQDDSSLPSISMRTFAGASGDLLPGTECASIALLDTPGLETQSHSLFSLALLSSSTVLLNTMGSIDLELIAQMRNAIKYVQGLVSPDMLRKSVTNLHVLQRDSSLSASLPGESPPRPMDAILHDALSPRGDSLDDVRRLFLMYFPIHTVSSIRKPDSADLAKLSGGLAPSSQGPFWNSFVASAQRTVTLLRQKVTSSEIPLSGHLLGATLQSFVGQINEATTAGVNAVQEKISVDAIVEDLLHRRAKNAVKAAKVAFSKVVDAFEIESSDKHTTALDDDRFEVLLQNATQSAYQEFLARVPIGVPAAMTQTKPYAELLASALQAESALRRLSRVHLEQLAELRSESEAQVNRLKISSARGRPFNMSDLFRNVATLVDVSLRRIPLVVRQTGHFWKRICRGLNYPIRILRPE